MRPEIADMVSITYPTKLSENLLSRLKERKAKTRVPVTAQIRRAIERELSGEFDTAPMSIEPDEALNQVRLPYLNEVPCGPWDEAAPDENQSFALSRDVALEMNAQPDDFAIRSKGESMKARGIPDHAIMIVRPLRGTQTPRRDEIVVMQIILEGEKYQGTVKVWRADGSPPKLEDGDGKAFEYPAGVVGARATGIVIGVVSGL